MISSGKSLYDSLCGQEASRRPVWLMRQAGRYLPEYRALREQAGSFLNLCLNPKWAAEITLQPLRRFDLDAAILFADILLVPYALGVALDFQEGEGPVLSPIRDDKDLDRLSWSPEKVGAVFETVARMKNETPEKVTRIGFSGGLWTVACYMIEGRGKQGFTKALEAAKNNPDFLERVLDVLQGATLDYLDRQIQAGAEVIQIFESWAGLLDDEGFQRFVVKPTKEIIRALKKKHPTVPVIGFPRGTSSENYRVYARETGVDGLGVDQDIPLVFIKDNLQGICALQGNMAPEILVEGGQAMKGAVEDIVKNFGPRHIFNLGHGVIQQTPPENVAELISYIRAAEHG